MTKSASVAVAAVLLLSGVSAASAASHMSNRSSAQDTLTLSARAEVDLACHDR